MRLITPLILILALCGCNPPDRMHGRSGYGAWASVDPPRGAPEGTTCWVWGTDRGTASIGGPTCLPPTPPSQDCLSCHPTN